MKINGQQAYPCMYECPRAIWVDGGYMGMGGWYCDDPSHDSSPQTAQDAADDRKTRQAEDRSFGATEH